MIAKIEKRVAPTAVLVSRWTNEDGEGHYVYRNNGTYTVVREGHRRSAVVVRKDITAETLIVYLSEQLHHGPWSLTMDGMMPLAS